MNFATVLQFDSFSIPTWAENAIRHTRKAAAQSHKVIKAFNKTIAPVIATTAKDLGHYYWLCFQGAEKWILNRQPISSAVRTVHTKLTSPESIATYRRIGYVSRESAMTALIIGLCGVVALSVSIEQAQKGYALAQKGCRAAQKLYGKVYARLNPSEPQPELLPSCEMALASTELAEALDNFATVVEADVKAKAEAEAEVQYCLESMKQPTIQFEAMPDFWAEPLPVVHTPPIVGPIWNPVLGRDIHQEVANLFKLQYVPFTLAPTSAPFDSAQGKPLSDHAPEPVAQPEQEPQPAPEPQPEQKPARKSRSSAKTADQAKTNPQPQQRQKTQRKPAKAKTGAKAGEE